jgi:hypothetical protein
VFCSKYCTFLRFLELREIEKHGLRPSVDNTIVPLHVQSYKTEQQIANNLVCFPDK